MFRKPRYATEDYTENMLPHTRREVFCDVFKLQWRKLLLLGLISLIFALPLLITSVFKDLYTLSAFSSLTGDELTAQLRNTANMFGAIDILLYVFYFLGFGSIARIIKLFAFEEPASVTTDFAKGFRQNALQYAVLGLLIGLMVFMCSFFSSSALKVSGGGIAWNLGDIPSVICALLLAPIGAYITVTMSVYKVSFRMHIKYGMILYGKSIFKTLAACICCFVIFVLQVFPMISGEVFYVHLVGHIVCPFAVPIIMLAFWLFSYNRLDNAINKDYYPELVGKGLAPVTDK